MKKSEEIKKLKENIIELEKINLELRLKLNKEKEEKVTKELIQKAIDLGIIQDDYFNSIYDGLFIYCGKLMKVKLLEKQVNHTVNTYRIQNYRGTVIID